MLNQKTKKTIELSISNTKKRSELTTKVAKINLY